MCGSFVSLMYVVTLKENLKFIFLAWEETHMTFQYGLFVVRQI